MEQKHSIPIIFGVTGHRDLREEDIPKLEGSVRELFVEYKNKYPHTEIIVLSALAEGADMLTARIAMELELSLHVVFPYEEQQYLKSFDDPENNIEKFQSLRDYAVRVVTNRCSNPDDHDVCYEELGKYIADKSNILLALWDGVETGKQGGTSAVVGYQRRGFEENRFDALDGNALFMITTPRKSNSEIKTDYHVEKEYLGKYIKGAQFDKMLQKIDALNAEIQPVEEADGSLLKAYMGKFEARAGNNQKKFKRYSKAVLILTGIAFASLETMHVLHINPLIIGYGVSLFFAFGLYQYFMKKGKIQDDFVYSRGFAEALRIQNAWNHVKIQKSISSYYLADQHHKFTWIKVVLKNLCYLDQKPFSPYGGNYNEKEWIDEQIDYFKTAVRERHTKFQKLEWFEKIFYRMGFAALVLMFLIYALESLHIVEHGALWFNWHYLVLASGLFLLVAAFIGEKYVKIEGYEEEIYHFNTMLSTFLDAKKELQSVTEGSEEYKKIIEDLGLKALDENSKWVVLHDSMRVKPSLD